MTPLTNTDLLHKCPKQPEANEADFIIKDYGTVTVDNFPTCK